MRNTKAFPSMLQAVYLVGNCLCEGGLIPKVGTFVTNIFSIKKKREIQLFELYFTFFCSYGYDCPNIKNEITY